MNPLIAVVVATYRRAPELRRLLASLQSASLPLTLFVVDNADDPETAETVREFQESGPARMELVRLTPGRNLGCGGGLAFGERAALERFGERLTHLFLLDDDAEVAPGALERLLAAMDEEGAALACPMILNGEGQIAWFPGLLDAAAFDAVRTLRDPAGYIARCGPRPVRFSWATGIALLVRREMLDQLGLHRDDFWIQGEDLEFTLRITARFPGIFVPDARVAHLPRPSDASPEAMAMARRKHRAMIQNVGYISLHLPHGRRILKNVPGNLWRFVKTWGPGSLPDGLWALWEGGGRGLPAGAAKRG